MGIRVNYLLSWRPLPALSQDIAKSIFLQIEGTWRMCKLLAVRSETSYEDENVWMSKPDYWIMGDKAGFDLFIRSLGQANKQEICFGAISNSNSVPIRLLKTARSPKSAKLRCVERVSFVNKKRPTMELLIRGSKAGYARLAKILSQMMDVNTASPLDEHWHLVDWADRWIVKDSVALNIRAPLSKWTRGKIGQYQQFIYDQSSRKDPPPLKYATVENWQYGSPTSNSSWLSLKDGARLSRG